MKSAVYTKAGQVGLATIERPQIIDADDVIIRVVRACVCGSDLWRYRNPETKDIEIAVMRLQELSKKLVRTLLQ